MSIPAGAALVARRLRARWPALIVLTLFAAVIVSKAWACDDAYIVFRTVDNFLHGHGLRYNVDERVQAFTSPLWTALIALVVSVTGEPYFSSLVLSLALSIAAAALLAVRLAPGPAAGAWAVLALLASGAFTDYSTSGLENPLAHLLIVVFLILRLNVQEGVAQKDRNILPIVLVAALLGTTRLDLLLLLVPALGLLIPSRTGLGTASANLRAARAVLLGASPLLAWEIASIVYYGFPFPNTAYAKLGTGIPPAELTERGVEYLSNSIHQDPVTLATIASASLLAAWRGSMTARALAAGIVIDLVYIVTIGGDFMSGRFLTAPFLIAVVLIADHLQRRRHAVAAAAVVILVAGGPSAVAFVQGLRGESHAARGAQRDNPALDDNGIADERAVYEEVASLWRAPRRGPWPNPRAAQQAADAAADWVSQSWLSPLQGFGIADRAETPPGDLVTQAAGSPLTPVVARGSIGCFGYYLGPAIHLLDFQALSDPLLARLPAMKSDPMLPVLTPRLASKKWRIGHFPRQIPLGYFETLATGENRIRDPDLAAYYDALSLITRGRIWDRRRLVAIWKMNLGAYDGLLRASRAASTSGAKGQAAAN